MNGYRGWETRRERDERVTENLPADLLPLWKRMRNQFKGSPMHRYEMFMQYVEEHEDEGIEALVDEADAAVARLIAEREVA